MNRYTKENPLRVITAFSGYDSQCMALDRIEERHEDFCYDLVAWCEIDDAACKAHDMVYPQYIGRNLGDICKVNWDDVPDADLFTYSFPCGLAGTMVKTIGGYRNIEDIQVGDMVLTYKNRYRKVTNTMQRNAPSFFTIKAVGCELFLTSEHPLWVLREGEQRWVKVADLRTTDKLSYCIPSEIKEKDVDDDILWLLGRYVADGWVNPYLYHSVCFAISFSKNDAFEQHIPESLIFRRSRKSCWEYRVADSDFQRICLECGDGAKNKKVPQWILSLPVNRLKIFLDGYFSGDGHLRYRSGTKVQMFSTVSKELALGIQLCLLKVYKKVCTISVRHDNRKATFSDTYNGQISFTTQTNGQETIQDKCFVPIRSIEERKGSVRVYNISVDEDESYTCDNVNTHNCQAISAAGLRHGFEENSGTTSSLLWECRKAVEAKRFKYLMMENVANLVSKKFLPYFLKWVNELEGYGYKNFLPPVFDTPWKEKRKQTRKYIMDASDYGVPQHRERVFMISILRSEDDPDPQYEFPAPVPLERHLIDVLEDNVEERYFVSDKMLKYFRSVDADKSHGHNFNPKKKKRQSSVHH